jgi:pyrroline-5-carboxylate reductase
LSIDDKRIAFIGGGHITEIILEILIRSRVVSPENLIVSDPDRNRRGKLSERFLVQTTSNNGEAVDKGEWVFINVRPQVVNEVVDDLGRCPIPEGKVFVSVAAGIPMEKYLELKDDLPVARAVPNPPSQIGQGLITVAFNDYVSDIQQKEILELFDSMGEVVILEEEHFNAASALSSPASVLHFFQSLIDAGVQSGLDREMSLKIARQTIVGVMEVWRQRKVPLAQLLDEACTPGGISEKSVLTLEKHGFKTAILEAIQNGAAKAEQIGGEIMEKD